MCLGVGLVGGVAWLVWGKLLHYTIICFCRCRLQGSSLSDDLIRLNQSARQFRLLSKIQGMVFYEDVSSEASIAHSIDTVPSAVGPRIISTKDSTLYLYIGPIPDENQSRKHGAEIQTQV